MATNTPRLGLRKPGGADNVTVLTDLDNNYDILDRAVLVAVGTERAVVTGGIDVSGGPTGYGSGEIRFPTVGAGDIGIYSMSTGAPGMRFEFRGVGNTGFWLWANGANAATVRMQLNTTGQLAVTGTQHGFGTGANGAAGSFASIGDFADPNNVYYRAAGTNANIGLVVQSKGTGEASLAAGDGTAKVRVSNGGLGFYGTAPSVKQTITGSRGGNAALQSLINNLVFMGLMIDGTTA